MNWSNVVGVGRPGWRRRARSYYLGAVLEGLDLAKVGPWLEANVEGAVGPFDASLIAGGRSNLTFTVTGSDGTKFVLRRPPLGHVLASAHDMAREHKIIAAVGKTSSPCRRRSGCARTSRSTGRRST